MSSYFPALLEKNLQPIDSVDDEYRAIFTLISHIVFRWLTEIRLQSESRASMAFRAKISVEFFPFILVTIYAPQRENDSMNAPAKSKKSEGE